jgi:prophage antirepressor-like protein
MERDNVSPKAATSKAVPIPFLFEGSQLVRVVSGSSNDDPWFVAADVCRTLRLGNTTMALKMLDADEKGLSTIETLGGRQELNTVSEPGLYKMIGRSRRPEARLFDRFVRHKILPTIRRTGRFEKDSSTTRLNTQAMNAASRIVGEVRRCHGPRAAAKALASIYARVAIDIQPSGHPQGELAVDEKPKLVEGES